MTARQFRKFEKEMEKLGYKLYKRARTIQNESFYYCKGFCYDWRKDDHDPGYQILFLVYDWSNIPGNNGDVYGVTPLVITSSDLWPRIDLELTVQKIDVVKFEKFASDFFDFLIVSSVDDPFGQQPKK